MPVLKELFSQNMTLLDPIGVDYPQKLDCTLQLLYNPYRGLIIKVFIPVQEEDVNIRDAHDLFESCAFRGYVNDVLSQIINATFPENNLPPEKRRRSDYLFRTSSYGLELKEDGSIIFSYNLINSDGDFIIHASSHDLMNLRKQAEISSLKQKEIIGTLNALKKQTT